MIEIDAVRIVSVSDAPWADVEIVFGTRGDPAGCWCQFFKLSNAEWKQQHIAGRKAALETQVTAASPPPGVIAYLGDDAVGWCAVEPRPNYTRLSNSRVAVGSADDFSDASVWAVTCFVVRVGFRRRGIGGALLQGAVQQARSLGARVVEGYPVDVEVRGKTNSADLYHGTASLFRAAGFTEIARPTPDRHVMRLPLDPPLHPQL